MLRAPDPERFVRWFLCSFLSSRADHTNRLTANEFNVDYADGELVVEVYANRLSAADGAKHPGGPLSGAQAAPVLVATALLDLSLLRGATEYHLLVPLRDDTGLARAEFGRLKLALTWKRSGVRWVCLFFFSSFFLFIFFSSWF